MGLFWRSWTPTEENKLAEMWPDHSAAEISKVLRKPRNAIIGKARRMKLDPKGPIKMRDGTRKLLKPRKPRAKPVVITKPSIRVSIRVIPAPPRPERGVPLLDATYGQCRAIVGSTDDGRALAMVCGEQIKPNQSYSFCAYHLDRFTTSSSRRNH